MTNGMLILFVNQYADFFIPLVSKFFFDIRVLRLCEVIDAFIM